MSGDDLDRLVAKIQDINAERDERERARAKAEADVMAQKEAQLKRAEARLPEFKAMLSSVLDEINHALSPTGHSINRIDTRALPAAPLLHEWLTLTGNAAPSAEIPLVINVTRFGSVQLEFKKDAMMGRDRFEGSIEDVSADELRKFILVYADSLISRASRSQSGG